MKNWIVLISILSFVSCKEKSLKTFYDNGSPHEEYAIDKSGSKEGPYKIYAENGALMEEGAYKQNHYVGTRKMYSNGILEIAETYDDTGSLQGNAFVYYPDGKVQIEKPYKDNKIQGILKGYYPTGAIKEEVTIVDNEENGPFIEYHPNGKVHWKGQYLNGDNEFGLLERFDTTGTLIKKMMCDSIGICRTFWKSENYPAYEED